MDQSLGTRLIDLRSRIATGFNADNWEELGLLTESSHIIAGHPRLLRSLSFGDDDYSGNVLTVLRLIVSHTPQALPVIESYVDKLFPRASTFISATPAERCITFAPQVFRVPDAYVEIDLAALMMPFSQEFRGTCDAIKRAAAQCGLRCLRADDIWNNSTIIQDIFDLIFRASVVIVDFSGKNPNVMYETGIAHTLGKHVVPISQSLDDVPFDMRQHRVLTYHSNNEGLQKLTLDLSAKLNQFGILTKADKPPAETADDEIPF